MFCKSFVRKECMRSCQQCCGSVCCCLASPCKVPDTEAWLRQLQWPLALIVDGKSVANTKARCVPWPDNPPVHCSHACLLLAVAAVTGPYPVTG